MTGTIFKALRGLYYVETADGTVRCEARGRFRHLGIKPLVGDRVEITPTEEERGIIDEILPRKNFFRRPPVANIDQLVFTVSEAVPVTDLFILDRMIAMAEAASVEPLICVNKCDIESGENLCRIYKHSGFSAIRVSAHTGEGIEELYSALRGKVSAFAGDTGVGKSSLLNILLPELSLETGEVSHKLGRGRHTTRHVEFFHIPEGGIIADTPGFASFDEEAFKPLAEDVHKLFREFAPYEDGCRFIGCAHVKERGCAVLDAVENGDICLSRHKSYVRMLTEAKEQFGWKK